MSAERSHALAFRMTPTLRAALDGVEGVDPDAETLSLAQVRALAPALHKLGRSFAEALQGAEMVLPEAEAGPGPPSKEYVERMDELRRREADRQYAEMVRNVDGGAAGAAGGGDGEADAGGLSEMRAASQYTGMLSTMLASMAAVFAAVYYVASARGLSPKMVVALALAGAVLIMVVEAALLVIRVHGEDSRKELEGRPPSRWRTPVRRQGGPTKQKQQ